MNIDTGEFFCSFKFNITNPVLRTTEIRSTCTLQYMADVAYKSSVCTASQIPLHLGLILASSEIMRLRDRGSFI